MTVFSKSAFCLGETSSFLIRCPRYAFAFAQRQFAFDSAS